MRVNPQLRVAAGMVEKMVPTYDIKQSNPVEAAKSGEGNCVSKAVIGGILLEHAKLIGPKTASAWNTRTHPKVGDDMFGRARVLNGHAQLLAATLLEPHTITALSFNPEGIESSNWQVFEFNDDDNYAEVVLDQIEATNEGQAVGFVIADWHAGSKMYHEALGQYKSIFHLQTATEIAERVIHALVQRDLLLEIK